MDRMKITNRAMAIALNRSMSCCIEMIRAASLIKAVENLRSATTREHTSSTTTGIRTGVSGECSIICLICLNKWVAHRAHSKVDNKIDQNVYYDIPNLTKERYLSIQNVR